jgi:hypothetical protein
MEGMSQGKAYAARLFQKRQVSEQIREILNSLDPNTREETVIDIVDHYNLIDLFKDIDLSSTGAGQHEAPESKGRGKYARTDTKQQAIVDALKKKPKMDIAKLAKTIYGSDDEQHTKRLRSLLYRLANNGMVERVGKDEWKAVAA